MKKISLVALLLATAGGAASAETLVPGCPKAFQGFHLGGNIGYGVAVATQKVTVEDTRVFKNDLGLRGVDGGIGLGYTHRFGNWGLGLAFDANWASTSGSTTRLGFDEDGNRTVDTLKARLKNSLQLYARAGYVIGGQAMPFIGLGWDNSQWNHKITRTVALDAIDDFSKSKNKRLNGFLWKVGVDVLATKHVVLGFEYTGTIAGKSTLSGENLEGEDVSASFKPQNNRFALTAKIVY